MTFTYDPTVNNDKDWLRYTLGDTKPGANPRLEDEEIQYELAKVDVKEDAIVPCATALLARIRTAKTSDGFGPVSMGYGSLAEQSAHLEALIADHLITQNSGPRFITNGQPKRFTYETKY